MKRLLLLLLLLLVVFLGYVMVKTFTFSSRQTAFDLIPKETIPTVAATHLAEAIAIPTISGQNRKTIDSAAFYRFRDFIKNTYALSDSLLEVTYINEFSLLYKWEGTDPALKPVILTGHLDVVPVPDENLSSWSVPPFAGIIQDDVIWGRGAIDNKNNVIGILEAVELLLRKGFTPKRTLYLCFGHDEEPGGHEGALPMANYLKAQGIDAEFVLDEGYAVTQGLVPGIEKDIAFIGTSEKGFVTFKLSVAMEGGHSSIPKKETAIDVLSQAVVRLKRNPFPAQITKPLSDFMQYAGPEMSFTQRMAFANPGIFKSMIFNIYEKQPSGNALIRTTTSPTVISGGVRENVIPYNASALVNFRVLPETTIAEVKQRVIKIIDDDRIMVAENSTPNEPSQVSDITSFGYQTIDKTIKQVFRDVIIAPNLVLGATDARHYHVVSKNIYRFTPFYLNNDNINSFHGIDERIPVEDFNTAIRFYIQLMRNAAE